jgi:guanine nucleotide-binding protein subunit alpha
MSTEDKEGKARNEEIENQLKRDRMQQRNEIKMLLLGTSTSCPAPLLGLVREREAHSAS